jgi:HlyD family secretion protein
MNAEQIQKLRIEQEVRRRPKRSIWFIFLGTALVTAIAAYYAWPRKSDEVRILSAKQSGKKPADAVTRSDFAATADALRPRANASKVSASPTNEVVLTVSGYIINRERIELSPRFMGVVKWIGVKKGDAVTNGQVVVLLDDAEYKARLKEAEGRLASATAAIEKAELAFQRISKLSVDRVESKQAEDEARLNLVAARATAREIEGQIELIKTYLEWTVIKSPIDGVVLEKLVDPNELVTPQSFGGTRGPSTALVALADPKDLQVEIDMNESDLSKIFLNQRCRVSPEAFPERVYEGYVAEIAPEANRQKGTLQIKVQIRNPDRFLTPELSAKVEFTGNERAREN